ncbi:MAG: NAD(P)/FAD-dependent oxidoreductase [Herpetosiphonaceae bacterium]|nr:NAD(P)/FAD-dependent oxidoreductase [Herpetosiphonaceae bacterium]
MTAEHVDVLIVGAGLSGIAAAYYLQTRCPTQRFAILEGRSASGGTWDLFRYPGVRSDSDMYTLGYSFRPWRHTTAIADGPSILAYIRETAEAFGIDRTIRFGHRVRRASWSSPDATWTVEVERGPDNECVQFICSFLWMCSGYYDYTQGYTPTWPGVERFVGRIVHPQQWPADLDYAGKQVVVIGSGATAITLVPALAEQAAHITMLQHSPTYVVAVWCGARKGSS